MPYRYSIETCQDHPKKSGIFRPKFSSTLYLLGHVDMYSPVLMGLGAGGMRPQAVRINESFGILYIYI